MSAADPSITSTPKRKRSELENDHVELPQISTSSFPVADVRLPSSPAADDGSISPRTKVAHRFRSLAIGRPRIDGDSTIGLGKIPAPRDPTATIPETPQQMGHDDVVMQQSTDDTELGARKRLKLPDCVESDSPADRACTVPQPLEQSRSKPSPVFALERPGTPPLRPSPPQQEFASITKREAPTSQTQSPSDFTWPPDPLPDSTLASQTEAITVAFRASMTWHEDEITIYDPDDSDDDGTGINGIGFKPTPAVAYARDIKRKQQLAEYRKREEREARARRSQRRRGSPRPVVRDRDENKAENAAAKMGEKQKEKQRRRVRFMEASVVAPAAV